MPSRKRTVCNLASFNIAFKGFPFGADLLPLEEEQPETKNKTVQQKIKILMYVMVYR
jgi:hypothetical protein